MEASLRQARQSYPVGLPSLPLAEHLGRKEAIGIVPSRSQLNSPSKENFPSLPFPDPPPEAARRRESAVPMRCQTDRHLELLSSQVRLADTFQPYSPVQERQMGLGMLLVQPFQDSVGVHPGRVSGDGPDREKNQDKEKA